MKKLAKLRRWLNRDDGRLVQVGNRPLRALEASGLLIAIAAIPLWQLHVKTGISNGWALIAGVTGLALATVGKMGGADDH